jgi:hypothetical protein
VQCNLMGYSATCYSSTVINPDAERVRYPVAKEDLYRVPSKKSLQAGRFRSKVSLQSRWYEQFKNMFSNCGGQVLQAAMHTKFCERFLTDTLSKRKKIYYVLVKMYFCLDSVAVEKYSTNDFIKCRSIVSAYK